MKKAETVNFVVMTLTAFILIGILFVSFGGKVTATGHATYAQNLCYVKDGESLYPAQIDDCCIGIKNSDGCKAYIYQDKNLYICSNVVVNKNTIEECQK